MAGSKELKVRWSPTKASLIEVYYEGGGQLPNELTGSYTDMKSAHRAVALYLASSKKSTGLSGGK